MNTFAAQERAEGSTPGAAADGGVRPYRLAWFREARFGMFIHWGPYSGLAGEWNGQQIKVGRNAEWIMHSLKISAGDRKVEVASPLTSDWYKYVTLDVRGLEITAAGEHELVLRPARELGQDLMYCNSLTLERVS